MGRASPLGTGRTGRRLGEWVDVRRLRSIAGLDAVGAAATKQLQSGLDVNVGRVQVGGALVGIQRIADLVVARLILCVC